MFMGERSKVFPAKHPGPVTDDDTSDSTMDESVDPPDLLCVSEVYIVIHDVEQQCPFDVRYSNYSSRLGNFRKNTDIVSVHDCYDKAASSASIYVRELWDMEKEDEEWLEQLDWQGDGWFDDEGGAQSPLLEELHRVHILAMQIN